MSKRIQISPVSYALFAFCFVMLPIRLLCAWIFAVWIHELGHLIALYICKVKVHYVKINGFGVNIVTDEMDNCQELICSLSGPLCGFALMFLGRWIPHTAIFAFVHSVYNLLPIFTLDGGRALRCVLLSFLGNPTADLLSTILSWISIFVIAFVAVYFGYIYHLSVLPVIVLIALLLQVKNVKALANRANK